MKDMDVLEKSLVVDVIDGDMYYVKEKVKIKFEKGMLELWNKGRIGLCSKCKNRVVGDRVGNCHISQEILEVSQKFNSAVCVMGCPLFERRDEEEEEEKETSMLDNGAEGLLQNVKQGEMKTMDLERIRISYADLGKSTKPTVSVIFKDDYEVLIDAEEEIEIETGGLREKVQFYLVCLEELLRGEEFVDHTVGLKEILFDMPCPLVRYVRISPGGQLASCAVEASSISIYHGVLHVIINLCKNIRKMKEKKEKEK